MAQDILNAIYAEQDRDYRDFFSRLVPNVPKETIIGVRAPAMKKLAKQFLNRKDFLETLPHTFFEEYALHAQILNLEKDFEKAVCELDHFLPYVDNWAVCDTLRPKAFDKHREEMILHAFRWCNSPETYTMRFGVEMLMTYCLDDYFSIDQPELISHLRPEDYYGKMMIAWYFATALSKQWDSIFPYILNESLDCWTHNKTIQKAVESFRITAEQKEFLKTLKKKA